MWEAVTFLCVMSFVFGVGAGFTVHAILAGRDRLPRPELPPATPRAIARIRRRRADIRPALARSSYDERHWLPPSIDDFDHLETK